MFRRVLLSGNNIVMARRFASRTTAGGLEISSIKSVHQAKDDATKLAVASITGTPFEQLKRVAHIARPARHAMQSGKDLSGGGWIITYPRPETWRNPLMGWTSSADPLRSMELVFDSKEAAIKYCEANAHDYVVEGERIDNVGTKSYASNFLPKTDPKTTVDFD